jgi:hypothetical protein
MLQRGEGVGEKKRYIILQRPLVQCSIETQNLKTIINKFCVCDFSVYSILIGRVGKSTHSNVILNTLSIQIFGKHSKLF